MVDDPCYQDASSLRSALLQVNR